VATPNVRTTTSRPAYIRLMAHRALASGTQTLAPDSSSRCGRTLRTATG